VEGGKDDGENYEKKEHETEAAEAAWTAPLGDCGLPTTWNAAPTFAWDAGPLAGKRRAKTSIWVVALGVAWFVVLVVFLSARA
jgi:hypothetical protein